MLVYIILKPMKVLLLPVSDKCIAGIHTFLTYQEVKQVGVITPGIRQVYWGFTPYLILVNIS